MYVKRTLSKPLLAASRQFPAILVSGPRQVGKTTLLQHTAEADRRYVTLDDPQARTLAKDDPGLFLQRFAPPVLIDEIQYAPELLPHIKMIVDDRHRPGDFWLTGSQHFHLMQGVSESLAGRVGIVNLLGFSRRELAGRSDCEPVGLWFPRPEPAGCASNVWRGTTCPWGPWGWHGDGRCSDGGYGNGCCSHTRPDGQTGRGPRRNGRWRRRRCRTRRSTCAGFEQGLGTYEFE